MLDYEYELIEHFFDDPDCCNIKRQRVDSTYEKPFVADYSNNGTKDLRVLKYMAEKANQYKIENRNSFIRNQANGRFKKRKSYVVTEPSGTKRIVSGINNIKFLYPELKSISNISSCATGKLKHYKKYKFKLVT